MEEKAGYFAIIVLQMFCYYSIHGMWLYLMVPWLGLHMSNHHMYLYMVKGFQFCINNSVLSAVCDCGSS